MYIFSNIKTARGFSTVELMIAFALMSLVFGGVVLAHFGAAYWVIASETSNEGLYKAKTRIEELRAVAKKDFRLASSSLLTKVSDTSCDVGGLCYYVASDIADLSPCSKYATARVEWQVSGYPTTTTALFTNLTDTNEAVSLGGDCPLTMPSGAWSAAKLSSSADIAGSAPTDADVLGGITYITSSQAPYLSIADGSGFISFTNSFAPMDPLQAIDVARDISTGRIYGYAAIASTSVQLEIFDLTDPTKPTSVAKLALSGVDKNGSFPKGWRLAYYSGKVYIATRETTGPEFHVIDVSNPANPTELGSLELNTSAYGIVVRDVKQGSTSHRLVFLATTMNSKEFMVLDATNPAAITELSGASTDLPGIYEGRSVYFAGNIIYVGRISNSGPELYALDASTIFNVSGGLPIIGSREIGGDALAIRVSEPYVFVGNTKSGKELQIFTTSNGILSSNPVSFGVSGFSGGMDRDGDSLYMTSGSSPRLRVIQSQ